MNEAAIDLRVKAFDLYRAQYSGEKASFLREWTPLRTCKEDYVISIQVVRIFRKRFEIALFAAGDYYKCVDGAGVMAGLIFCLSDAYYKTGSMELHFCGPKNGAKPTIETGFEPHIPDQIVQYAKSIGISFQNQRFITNAEGCNLYCIISGLSPQNCESLRECGCDEVHTAFLINRGVWTREQIGLIIKHYLHPKDLLAGIVNPAQRVPFSYAQLVLRCGLLAERTRIFLELSNPDHAQLSKMAWLEVNQQLIKYEGPIEVRGLNGSWTISGGSSRVVYLPFDSQGYQAGGADLLHYPPEHKPTIIVVTKDFDWIDNSIRKRIINTASENKIILLQIAETLNELDEAAFQKLDQAASTRRPLPERPE